MPIAKNRKQKKQAEEYAAEDIYIKSLPYKVIKTDYIKFNSNIYRLYFGNLEIAIKHFKRFYGEIDGPIYYDRERKLIGFTGSQVVPRSLTIENNNNRLLQE